MCPWSGPLKRSCAPPDRAEAREEADGQGGEDEDASRETQTAGPRQPEGGRPQVSSHTALIRDQ